MPLCLGPLPHLHWPLWPISQPRHPPWMLLYSHWCPIWASKTPPRMVMSSWKTPQQCLRHRWHMLLQRYLGHCQHSAFSITGIHYCNGASGIVSKCCHNGASGIISECGCNSASGIVSPTQTVPWALSVYATTTVPQALSVNAATMVPQASSVNA